MQAGSGESRYSSFKRCFQGILEREGIAGLYKAVVTKALRNSCYSISTPALMFGLARVTGARFPDLTGGLDIEKSLDTPAQQAKRLPVMFTATVKE
jgi:hypothetical protein